MEIPTFIVDDKTFVGSIHQIKEWVYTNKIRILVPLCTFKRVNELSDALLDQRQKEQEARKEAEAKRPSHKASRKEPPPLYDINPLVASEFLSRLQAGETGHAVKIQSAEEEYTPWKQLEIAAEAEAPQERPSTFAQALLSKLNIAGGGAFDDKNKGPPKPKLVARSLNSPNNPWKTHKKIPVVSAKDVPDALKPLLSYVLWRLYEYDNFPMMPEPCFLLSNDLDTCRAAQKLSVPAKQVSELRATIATHQKATIDRNLYGDVEKDIFREEPNTENGNVRDRVNGGIDRQKSTDAVVHGLGQSTDLEHAESEVSTKMDDLSEKSPEKVNGVKGDDMASSACSHHSDKQPQGLVLKETKLHGPNAEFEEVSTRDSNPPSDVEPQALPAPAQIQEKPRHESVKAPAGLENGHKSPTASNKSSPASSTDSDSDEEVIIFKPSLKRRSNPPPAASTFNAPQTQPAEPTPVPTPAAAVDISTSRPTSAHASQSPKLNNQQKQFRQTRHPRQRAPRVAPTIIDPDAFDRSSIVTVPSSYNSQHRDHRANMRQGSRGQPPSPHISPRRGQPPAPTPAPRAQIQEPEVDYVLRSGAPRGAARGRGKLWVP